jgi:hypothetical protein
MRCRFVLHLAFVTAVFLAMSPTGSVRLRAQGQSGSIAGVVRDSSGAVLPGVSVEASSPALIEKSRSVVTNNQGQYQILDLRPGTYTVTFTLQGFTSVRREGIELTTGFTANVSTDMRIGALQETVTVTGESLVVDTQNAVKQVTATREVMDTLPTDRNFVSFAALTPSVLVTGVRQNVGGSIPETGMNLVVHGSRASDSLVTVEGMPIINGGGTGGLMYGNYLNNGLAQEITFQTDSHNAEYERATVYSNFIPKEGSNQFRGTFSSRYAGEGWQANNLDAELEAKNLRTGNRIDRIWDINPNVGGPIIRDRLWVYGGYRHWGTYNTVAGSYQDADFSETLYSCNANAAGQCTTEQNLFPVWHQSAVARFTAQLNQKNKLNTYIDWQYTYFGNCFVPTFTTAISACPEFKNIPQYIVQASWSSPVTNKLLLEAGGTITPQDFHGYRRPGVSATQFSISERFPAPGYPTTWGSSPLSYGYNRSDQLNFRGSASYVTGAHNTKVGFTVLHAWRYATQEPNNSVTLQLSNGQPFSITQYATPIQFHETVNYNLGLYAQDQWRMSRLTLNYGLRYDALKGQVDAQDITAGPFIVARHFDAIPNVPNWKDIDPRFGAVYDLFGDGRTALKASVGRYVVGESYTIARAVNPVAASFNSTTRTWTTPAGVAYNGNFNPYDDCDLFNPAPNTKRPGQIQCGAYNQPLFGQVGVRTTNYDPEIVEGWHVRPNNWEMQFSVQRELFPRISAYAGYTRRWYGNLYATRNLNVTNADYTPYCFTRPPSPNNNGELPGVGQQQCGLFDVNRFITANNLIFNSTQIGGIDDIYDGFDFEANARLRRSMFVSGGVSLGRERVNTCNLKDDLSLSSSFGRGGDPRTEEFCDVRPPLQPQVKGQVSSPLLWGINVAATFQSLSGPELRAQYPLTNNLAGLTLGRNFTGAAPTVDLIPSGTMYGDRIWQTDLRFSTAVNHGRTVIRPTISIYNLFNANPIQTYTFGYSQWLAPQVILQSRFVDLGVQVDF